LAELELLPKMEFYLKGQFFLDMATIQNVVMDKTGNIDRRRRFKVQEVVF
jgi:hypothetical protein